MKILYHHPFDSTLSAGRTISVGYRNAFLDFRDEFKFLTNRDTQFDLLIKYKPDIFFTSLSILNLKNLCQKLLKEAKDNGTIVFVNTPFWNSPFSKLRITESNSLSRNKKIIELIKGKNFGDAYFNICEQNDPRMKGFEETTGYKYETILLAADKRLIFPEIDEQYCADLSYIGTNLPQKKTFFDQVIFPLRNKYKIKIYGQDWTKKDVFLGYMQKAGQLFDINYLSSIRKPQLDLDDERKIYSSSTISFNVHEDYQKKFGDLNERTFKIPLANGFEIIDNVSSVSKYFKIGKEIVVAESQEDWLDKIQYYLQHPDKRLPIIKAGRKKILKYHTYHNRVEQIKKIYEKIKKEKGNS